MVGHGTWDDGQSDQFIFLTVLLESLCRGRCGENGSGETGKVSERSEMLLFLLASLVLCILCFYFLSLAFFEIRFVLTDQFIL